jgi:hypothetical protein
MDHICHCCFETPMTNTSPPCSVAAKGLVEADTGSFSRGGGTRGMTWSVFGIEGPPGGGGGQGGCGGRQCRGRGAPGCEAAGAVAVAAGAVAAVKSV